jgi:hypothetical protein
MQLVGGHSCGRWRHGSQSDILAEVQLGTQNGVLEILWAVFVVVVVHAQISVPGNSRQKHVGRALAQQLQMHLVSPSPPWSFQSCIFKGASSSRRQTQVKQTRWSLKREDSAGEVGMREYERSYVPEVHEMFVSNI